MSTSYSLFKSKFKKSIAESIYKEVESGSSIYHHFLGKENVWTDFLSPFIPSSPTDVPGPPQDNFRYDLHVRRDILATKKIKIGDVAYIAPRYNWQSGLVYDMYDDAITPEDPAYSGATRLEDAKFYVLTDDFNVYKCISNNYNAISTVRPTGTNTDTITTADGYIWKFMYTIPISLKNRFLSSEYIPVTTSLKSQYYSGGKITDITIDRGGSNYLAKFQAAGTISSTTSSKTVTGVNTSFVTQLVGNLITSGNGYILKKLDGTEIGTVDYISSPTVLVLKANALVNTTNVAFTATPPVTATAIIIGDGYIENNPYIIDGINITNAGSGYSSAPTITFSGPTVISGSEITAQGQVTISGGAVNTTSITVAGYGYEAAPIITVDPPIAGVPVWLPNTAYSNGEYVSFNGIYYSVTSSGTSGGTAPTHTSGAALNGTAELTFAARIAVLSPVLVKTEAQIELIIAGGEITGVSITDGGIGYTYASIQVIDQNHANPTNPSIDSNAFLSANLDIGNINTLQANVELMSKVGTIEFIKVVDGGIGYSTSTVQILGDGTGATATATMSAGRITRVNMVTKGTGYTWTNVVITGNGTGASARAIMSPLKGHGRDAVDELNANSIMFYSSIGRDVNQGLSVTNDYRKAGLLKNIRKFGLTTKFTDDNGSGCALITGVFDVTKLRYDMLLVNSIDQYKHYRIVEFNETQILISVFNNFSINIFDTLLTPDGDQVQVTDLKERTIDQFSGELLFLTVREPFAPSDEQIVTLRTVVTI